MGATNEAQNGSSTLVVTHQAFDLTRSRLENQRRTRDLTHLTDSPGKPQMGIERTIYDTKVILK